MASTLTAIFAYSKATGRAPLWLACLLILTACAGTSQVSAPAGLPVSFDSDFEMGRLSSYTQTGPNSYAVVIDPEHSGVNNSPWFAYRISSDQAHTITVRMSYSLHGHRFPPKTGTNPYDLQQLPDQQVKLLDGGKAVEMTLLVGPEPLYVAAQNLLDNAYNERWIQQLAEHPEASVSLLGRSVQGRPIEQLIIDNGQSNLWILITGRQHPAEVPGAITLVAFLDEVFADNPVANSFRQKFNLWIIPALNPDGIAAGHWRFNAQHTDLNRDWGLFKQPEILLVHRALQRRFEQPDTEQKLVLGLDFHSTYRNVLYTQKDGEPAILGDFTPDWHHAITTAMPEYNMGRSAITNYGNPTFKQYISMQYDIPGITYEAGDKVPHAELEQGGRIAATTMMALLLDASFETRD
ncbi:MAG: M14 family metallopeptidase [Gammaproteobacteria bacterium]